MTGVLDPATPLQPPAPAVQVGEVESAVHSSLSEPRWQGALLVGPPGIGKTRTIDAAIERFTGAFDIERLLCTSHLSSQPYGCFELLASDGAALLSADPLSAYAIVTSSLRERAQGRPVLLVIDNCDRIDELSGSLVAQLVRQREVSLLAATDTLTAPVDLISALWLERRIRRIDLDGLDRSATKRLLERTLGGEVSPRAVDTFCTATGGNPQLLIELARHQRQRGTLELDDDTWLLTAPLDYGGGPHVTDNRLGRLSPTDRDVVLTIALVEAVPMSVLLKIVNADVVGSLLCTGLLRTSTGPRSTVTLAEPALSEMLAHSLPPVRRLRLWEALRAVVDPATLPPESRLGFARCAVRCRTPVEPWLVESGAAHALARGDAHQVLELAAHGDDSDPRLQLQVARSLHTMGRFEQMHAVLEPLDHHPDPEIAEGAYILRLGLSHPIGDAPELPPHVARRGSAQLRVAQARRFVRGARFTEAIELCAPISHDLEVPPVLRAAAAARQGESLIAIGKVAEGLGYAARALQMLELSNPSPSDLLTVYYSLFSSFQLSGAVEFTDAVIESMRSLSSSDSGAQVIFGIEALRRGRVRYALSVLTACAGELQRDDALGISGVTDAARRLALKLLDPEVELPDPEPLQPMTPWDWQLEQRARYMRWAEIAVTDREQAGEGMQQLAQQMKDDGGLIGAIHILIQAANCGNMPAAEELADLPAPVGAPVMTLARTLGRGLQRGSVPELLGAATLAETQGDLVLAHSVAEQALDLARGHGDRSEIRPARARAGRAYRLMRQARGLERPATPLSDFEREVAEAAAAGFTSQELGTRFHLSARTVEWHLDKIYQRLHVSSRRELRQALREDSEVT
ncbi:LuxR C-terminal-related transcriptional regulator [Brachybacterium sp. p3-SID1565]|uniref:LuxR C-terminal-related transcriptional regulator n=1 Tax=Brachybacterium sp. p3-SID1565 TaxID=2916046 RepID=UPI0021A4636A|nr:AAA family ATPase [Brachybacterium sp. p3-SID1565]MCT1386113.1 LuxR C-terminal-related transcriptional regulator [Brachybacterium sp. p3-SID1565]